VFGVTVRLMSDGELAWLGVLRDLDQRRLTTEAAARSVRRSSVEGRRSLSKFEHAGARSVKQPVWSSAGASGAGPALCYAGGSAPARRPTQPTLAFLNDLRRCHL